MRIKFLDHAKDVCIEENFLIADDEIFEINDNECGELSIKKVEEFLHNPIECDLSSEDVKTDQNENLFEVGNAEIDKAIEIENENLDKDVNKHKTNSAPSDMAVSLNEVETFDKSVLQRLFPDISVRQKNHKDWMTDFEKEIDSYLKTLKQQSASSCDIAASLNEVETFDKSVLQRLFPDISVKQKNHKDWMTDFEKQIDSHLKTLNSSSIKSERRIQELEAIVKINNGERNLLVDKLQILKNYQKAEEKKWQESLKAKELELQQAKKEVLKSKEEVLKAAGNKKGEDCVICMDTITDPVRLNCGHNFCKGCIDAQFKFKPACPICGHVCGVIIGDQPDGTMRHYVDRYIDCSGYTGVGRIAITYDLRPGRQGPDHPSPGTFYQGFIRNAFLPNNDEGRKILAMLEIAFKRKLVFTIGNSRTTGQEGVITWNDIHHKTNPKPHQQNGYPDPDYLKRVKDELAAKGVTEKDIKIQ